MRAIRVVRPDQSLRGKTGEEGKTKGRETEEKGGVVSPWTLTRMISKL